MTGSLQIANELRGQAIWAARSASVVSRVGQDAECSRRAGGATTATSSACYIRRVTTELAAERPGRPLGTIAVVIAIATRGRVFATSSNRYGGIDRTAKVWDAATGVWLGSVSHDFVVNAASFAPDGARS